MAEAHWDTRTICVHCGATKHTEPDRCFVQVGQAVICSTCVFRAADYIHEELPLDALKRALKDTIPAYMYLVDGKPVIVADDPDIDMLMEGTQGDKPPPDAIDPSTLGNRMDAIMSPFRRGDAEAIREGVIPGGKK